MWVFLDRQLIREANHHIYIGTSRARNGSEKLLSFPLRKPILVRPFFNPLC